MDERELIKSKIDIVEFISSYIPLKKTGRNFRARCPFHSEKTPSFTVSPERQIFKCFGCGKAGDVFGFLMEYEKMGFGEAIRTLAEKTGVKLEYRGGASQKDRDEREILFEINHLTSEFYNYVLVNTKYGKKALDYLTKRGITKESINLFKIGYAPNSFESLIKFLKKKGYPSGELVKSGVAVGYGENLKDRFYGRLMFSLFDHRGNCVGFAGRVLAGDDQGKQGDQGNQFKVGKYINTSETPAYHKSEVLYGFNVTKDHVRKEDSVVIVEGEIDLIKAYQVGTKNIVAIKGSALTEQQVVLLKRYTENLKICLDSDFAGQMAALRGIVIAEKSDLNIKVIELMFGKDPDECISKDPKIWKKSLDVARDINQFFIDLGLKQFDINDTTMRKKFTEFVFPKINSIANLVVRDHYVKELSSILDVDEEVVVRQMEEMEKRKKTGREIRASGEIRERVVKDRREELEENLLSLILQSDDAKKYIEICHDLQFKTPVIKKIYNHLLDFLSHDVFTIANFVQKLPEELRDKVDELYLKDLGFTNLLKVVEKQIKENANEIEKLDLKEKIQEILAKMRESDEEMPEFGKLNDELQGLNSKLNGIS